MTRIFKRALSLVLVTALTVVVSLPAFAADATNATSASTSQLAKIEKKYSNLTIKDARPDDFPFDQAIKVYQDRYHAISISVRHHTQLDYILSK